MSFFFKMYKIFYTSAFSLSFFNVIAAPQAAEANEQLEITDRVTQPPGVDGNTRLVTKIEENATITHAKLTPDKVEPTTEVGFTVKVYRFISEPIIKIVSEPKVTVVLRNVGTCLVNGAMEIFSHYFPPAFMPIIASAAGLVIPFEPVVMLKEKMPVTSYRRAFNTAMKTFLRTFDRFKMAEDFDPYMTRRFNRRFMDDKEKKPDIDLHSEGN